MRKLIIGITIVALFVSQAKAQQIDTSTLKILKYKEHRNYFSILTVNLKTRDTVWLATIKSNTKILDNYQKIKINEDYNIITGTNYKTIPAQYLLTSFLVTLGDNIIVWRSGDDPKKLPVLPLNMIGLYIKKK